jgi:hypothetical protein
MPFAECACVHLNKHSCTGMCVYLVVAVCACALGVQSVFAFVQKSVNASRHEQERKCLQFREIVLK